jgi:hypothetical protein
LFATLDAAANPFEAIQALAEAEIRTSEGAMAAALGRADALDRFTHEFDWSVLDAIKRLSDNRQSAAAAVLQRTGEAIAADEHVQPLEHALRAERAKALALLADVPPPEARPQPNKALSPPPPKSGQTIIAEGSLIDVGGNAASEAIEDLRGRFSEHPDARLSLSWRLTTEEST